MPFADGASVAIVSMDGPLLAVASEPDGGVRSAVLEPTETAWSEPGAVAHGFPAEYGITTGPRAADYGTSLVWTGERVIDFTHAAVFDPATALWGALPLPEDLVAFTHLLYANPVWDGEALIVGYPAAVPGLAYRRDGSGFAQFDGLDPGDAAGTSIGPGFSVPLGDDVLFVRDGGFSAVYSSRADAWRTVAPVPGVDDMNACPGNIASLGDSVVVAPCYGEPPLQLVDGAWVAVEPYPDGPCCAGVWTGVPGALVVWQSSEVTGGPDTPRALVWVPPTSTASAPAADGRLGDCPNRPAGSSPAEFDAAAGTYAASIESFDPTSMVMSFDVVQWLSGQDAVDAYHEVYPDDPSGPPNVYWVRNESPVTREASVDAAADLLLVRLETDLSADVSPGELTELPTYLGRTPFAFFWLTFENGSVVAICEQYTP
ncbi:MAG: hypothetical protein R2695_15295 [Acidimicrobiales bacterium]